MNVPDAAIEAAAEAMWRHVQDTNRMHVDLDPKPKWTDMGAITKNVWRREAREAIEAAMPAIREAIAQEVEAVNDTIEEAFWHNRPGMARAARIVRGGTP